MQMRKGGSDKIFHFLAKIWISALKYRVLQIGIYSFEEIVDHQIYAKNDA